MINILASYINVNSLKAIHKTMDKNKASGIDKVTKEEYEQNLKEAFYNGLLKTFPLLEPSIKVSLFYR